MRFMEQQMRRDMHSATAIVLVMWLGSARGEVLVRDHARSYEVEGRTLATLRQELLSKGPAGPNGRHVAGLTTAELEWTAVYEDTGKGCRVGDHQVELDVTTTLPHWVQRAVAPHVVRRRWDSAAAAITEHEAGHRALAVQAAHALGALIAGFVSQAGCMRAATDLEWEAWKLHQRTQREHDRFDRVTGSGTKRGAVL